MFVCGGLLYPIGFKFVASQECVSWVALFILPMNKHTLGNREGGCGKVFSSATHQTLPSNLSLFTDDQPKICIFIFTQSHFVFPGPAVNRKNKNVCPKGRAGAPPFLQTGFFSRASASSCITHRTATFQDWISLSNQKGARIQSSSPVMTSDISIYPEQNTISKHLCSA